MITDEILRAQRARIPQDHPKKKITPETKKEAIYHEERIGNFGGKPVGRIVIMLRSSGCEWALKSGGCTMCGMIAGSTQGLKVSSEDYLKQFDTAYDIYKNRFSEDMPILCLYNNGSFLNENELPPNVRKKMLEIISKNDNIKEVILESRPEYVTESNVKEIRDILKGKHVEISVGLETKNDEIRNKCIHKGFTLKQFEKAGEIIKKYLDLRAYVLVKPPLISEKEAIKDAIESIKYAFDFGANTVSLEGLTVQKYALTEYLYHTFEENNILHFRPPWLWSLIDIVKKVRTSSLKYKNLILGLFQFFPFPTYVPHNCAKCNNDILKIFENYVRTMDVNVFENIKHCNCIKAWRKELEREYPPLEDRLKMLEDEYRKSPSR